MENYINKLDTCLGCDHPCTKGFREINALMKIDKSANTGILYTGSHFVYYSANEDEFVVHLLSNKTRPREALEEAAVRSINLVDSRGALKIYPLDDAAMSDIQDYFNGNHLSLHGIELKLNAFCLADSRRPGKNLGLVMPEYVGIHALIPDLQCEREEFLKALREDILCRYSLVNSSAGRAEKVLAPSEKA